MTPDELLVAYDTQLRGLAEMYGADRWIHDEPVWCAVNRTRGFATTGPLGGLGRADLERLVGRTVTWFRDDTDVTTLEWKTRAHDDLPDLETVLTAAGFAPEELETVMAGDAASLAVDVPLRDGLVVRRLDDGSDAERLLEEADALLHGVFGGGPRLAQLVARGGGRVEAWGVLDEAGDPLAPLVCAGRLEAVPGTAFAGLWGGATLPAYRGLGAYRALTAARARSTLERGLHLLQSDCSPMSRPILERAGLVAISTTTPWVWRRGRDRIGETPSARTDR